MPAGDVTRTQRFLQQAGEAFRDRCMSNPPPISGLTDLVIDIAKQVAEAMTPDEVLLVLQENPEWVRLEAPSPGRDPIAKIIESHLAFLIRRHLNTHWAILLGLVPSNIWANQQQPT